MPHDPFSAPAGSDARAGVLVNGRHALIEMAFVYSVVLGFAFWELRKTKKDRGPPK